MPTKAALVRLMSVFAWRRPRAQVSSSIAPAEEQLFAAIVGNPPPDLLARQADEVERLLRDHPVSRRVGQASFDEDLGSLVLTLVSDKAPLSLDDGPLAWSEWVTIATADAAPARQIVAMTGLGETRVSFRGFGAHLVVTAHCERWVYSVVGYPALEGTGSA